MNSPVASGLSKDLYCPIRAEIFGIHKYNIKHITVSYMEKNDGLVRKPGALWISDCYKKQNLRLLISAHTGAGLHIGWSTTYKTVSSKCSWKSMAEDVKTFFASFLHCSATDSSFTIPRPLGHTMPTTKPNELIHLDFCYGKGP